MPGPSYQLVDTPEGFKRAADALAAGRGPFAVDTERASAFRYDDRAFLVQVHRRDSGTFLIAPEGRRREVTAILAPVLNGGDWIIHAAGEDLTSLAMLGLHPGRLFDTELAARFAGFERPNLAAMVEHFTGVHLEKGHGRENWSVTPLPRGWLEYAADDVLYLNALAEALAETLDAAGVLGYAEEEFQHLLLTRSTSEAAARSWRDLKGLSSVHTARGLQIARELFTIRDRRALSRDVSPASVMPNRVLVAIARAEPQSPAELAKVPGFPGRDREATRRWNGYVERALSEPPTVWPAPERRDPLAPPSKSNWERHHPGSWDVLIAAKEAVAGTAHELGFPPEILLSPAALREAVWKATQAAEGTVTVWDTHRAVHLLQDCGARQWQAEIAAPLVADAFRATF